MPAHSSEISPPAQGRNAEEGVAACICAKSVVVGQASRLLLRASRPRGCSRARRPLRQPRRLPHYGDGFKCAWFGLFAAAFLGKMEYAIDVSSGQTRDGVLEGLGGIDGFSV